MNAYEMLDSFIFPESNDVVKIPDSHRNQRIRELAYYKWIDAGCPTGTGYDFWLQAETEYEAAERLVLGD